MAQNVLGCMWVTPICLVSMIIHYNVGCPHAGGSMMWVLTMVLHWNRMRLDVAWLAWRFNGIYMMVTHCDRLDSADRRSQGHMTKQAVGRSGKKYWWLSHRPYPAVVAGMPHTNHCYHPHTFYQLPPVGDRLVTSWHPNGKLAPNHPPNTWYAPQAYFEHALACFVAPPNPEMCLSVWNSCYCKDQERFSFWKSSS